MKLFISSQVESFDIYKISIRLIAFYQENSISTLSNHLSHFPRTIYHSKSNGGIKIFQEIARLSILKGNIFTTRDSLQFSFIRLTIISLLKIEQNVLSNEVLSKVELEIEFAS